MDRQDFANILDSIILPEGTSPEVINEKMRPLSEARAQMLPKSLFRYMSCNDYTTGALKNELIYAKPANQFNDPYDTLARYDLQAIKEGINAMLNRESLMQLKAWFEAGNDFPDSVRKVMPEDGWKALRETLIAINDLKEYESRIEESRRAMVSSIETYFPILAEMSKRFSTIACFSENVRSILMWSHYADKHKGFALEYDFRPTLKTQLSNTVLFPVIYDDERQDISLYVAWAFLSMMGIPTINPDQLAYYKIALHKSRVWESEKEWRLIDFSPRDIFSDKASSYHYKPIAIYYGKHMLLDKKEELHEIAIGKGIAEYEMFIDYSSPLYEMKFRPYKQFFQ